MSNRSVIRTVLNLATALAAIAALSPALASAAPAESGAGRAKAPVSPGPALPVIEGVDIQPLAAQVKRLLEALDFIGEPLLAPGERKKLLQACATDDAAGLPVIQQILDAYCLFGVNINPESRVKVAQGPAVPMLVEQGWRTFLIKVHNEAGVTAVLKAESPNAKPVYEKRGDRPEPEVKLTEADVRNRWTELNVFNDRPLAKQLSGLHLEYRIIQLFSRDAGQREATVSFHVGQGTQDTGFRNDVAILFTAAPSKKIKLHVLDEEGKPTTASFIFRDEKGRVYPSQAKRLAPDFFFHAQVYRADGETITLPDGTYNVEFTRGPEYHTEVQKLVVSPDDANPTAEFSLKRWIHPAKMGWFSGDHHVHAAGCAHYTDPQQGVKPEDMMRHIVGEDLNVGCVLSWGPCWYFQKTFFEGKVSPLSKPNYIMRYDVEVSGFPSDYCGHLCLLGLKEDDFTYPKELSFNYHYGDDRGRFTGTKTSRIGQWPTWDLPILQWGKSQGAVVGFSHSGWGLATQEKELPNFEIPPYDGIGANEYIVDVTHDVVDFISSVDTPWPYELNIWYHTNNAGFRARLSGETDFPCIYGDRVGLGRIYAKVDGPLKFDPWLAAMKAGRSYVSDGKAHLLDFTVNERSIGTEGSELKLSGPQSVKVTFKAAALLNEKPNDELRRRAIDEKPFWDIERARVAHSRRVPVEIIVNGKSVERKEIEANGKVNDLEFEIPIERSSWVAARVFASAHTNPIYVLVGDKPIRASRKSVEWCIKGVEQCWASKSTSKNRLREEERPACKAAYDHASEVYKKLLVECEVD